MKNLIYIITIVSILLTSCSADDMYITGEGEIVTKEIELNDLKGVESNGDFKVYVKSGDIQKIEVKGHANIIDRLKHNVDNEIWSIDLESGNYRDANLSIYITVPTINYFSLNGSGRIEVGDFYSESEVKAFINGSGTISFEENYGCENLKISIDGSGKINTSESFMNLVNLSIEINGSADYYGFPLEAKNCDLFIGGSGTCDVYSEDILNVKINGSGRVNYKGNPKVNSKISGSGKVNNSN